MFKVHLLLRLLTTHIGMINSCPVERVCIYHIHSPCRFNLAPEAEGFIHIEFALSCQCSKNVLLQPDGLRSVPTVGWLISARDIHSLWYQVTNRPGRPHLIKYCAKRKSQGKVMNHSVKNMTTSKNALT